MGTFDEIIGGRAGCDEGFGSIDWESSGARVFRRSVRIFAALCVLMASE